MFMEEAGGQLSKTEVKKTRILQKIGWLILRPRKVTFRSSLNPISEV
jgi:hypothetical protein